MLYNKNACFLLPFSLLHDLLFASSDTRFVYMHLTSSVVKSILNRQETPFAHKFHLSTREIYERFALFAKSIHLRKGEKRRIIAFSQRSPI